VAVTSDDGYDENAVRRLYDGMAADYAVRFGSELADADPDDPDLDFLSAAADGFPDGPVVDLGCGPGQVSRYLVARGRTMIGIDFAPGMLAAAAQGVPQASLIAADLLALPLRPGTCAAAVASYSLHHLPKARLGLALAGLRRVLVPGGLLVVITHGGGSAELLDRPTGPVLLSTYSVTELTDRLRSAGLNPELTRTRPPRPGEYPAEKIRITARKSAGTGAAADPAGSATACSGISARSSRARPRTNPKGPRRHYQMWSRANPSRRDRS
jgi:SAM-dependent methyltransferase